MKSLLAFVATPAVRQPLELLLADLKLPAGALITGSEHQAIDYLAIHSSPQLLIVEITDLANRESVLAQLADVVEPDCQVILLGAGLSVSEYRELKTLGILEYFDTPLDMQALRHLCAHALGMTDSPVTSRHGGRIITVSGIQGGVGTSSVAAALAQQLAQQGSHTLLAQLDDELGDVAGFWPKRSVDSPLALHQLSQPQLIPRATEQLSNRLDWLCSSESRHTSSAQLGVVNDLLAEHYTRVVWDCEKHHALAPDLWARADICIWVFESSVALIDQWQRIQSRFSAHAHQRHILVVNQTRPERSRQIPAEQLTQLFGQAPLVIPYCKEQPVFAANLGDAALLNSGKFALAMASLVDTVQLHKRSAEPTPGGLWQRLRLLLNGKNGVGGAA
ncbi:cellulose synthase operon protein YhjQ/BcsQ [Bacterioplanoides sp.]|uniref:cellulose synthase operon protein YhjQ/BcsQ n=1 Tax=Bacterioplanoides sp. TaxID=2066072 RepID=UPI003B000F59